MFAIILKLFNKKIRPQGVYSKFHPDKLKFHFKDIANFVINAFREYEPNFIALRKEIDTPGFAENLSTKNKNKLLRLEYIE